ncbi:TPA: hypothetical protein DD617_03380 [Candidatus Uhrbacteria bacterium]|nr:hypothetical protein [Candidatus Uhrbacteria bacterium]
MEEKMKKGKENIAISQRFCRWAVREDGLKFAGSIIAILIIAGFILGIDVVIAMFMTDKDLVRLIAWFGIIVFGFFVFTFSLRNRFHEDEHLWGRALQHLGEKLAYQFFVRPHEVRFVHLFGLKETRRQAVEEIRKSDYGYFLDWTRKHLVVRSINEFLLYHAFIQSSIQEEGIRPSPELLRLKRRFWAAWNMASAMGIPLLKVKDYVFCRKAVDVLPTFQPFDRSDEMLRYFDRFCIHANWAVRDENTEVARACRDFLGTAGADLVAYVADSGIDLRKTKVGQDERSVPFIERIEAAFACREAGMDELHKMCTTAQWKAVLAMEPHVFLPIREQVLFHSEREKEGYFRRMVDIMHPTVFFDVSQAEQGQTPWRYSAGGPYWSEIHNGRWIDGKVRQSVLDDVFGIGWNKVGRVS